MAKYSEERLEEILSEFRDMPEDVPPEAFNTSSDEPTEAEAEAAAAETDEAAETEPTHESKKISAKKLKIKFDPEKLAADFGGDTEAFSGGRCAAAAAGLILFIAAWALPTQGILRGLSFAVPYLVSGAVILFAAFRAVRAGRYFDPDLIISITSLLAFCIGRARDAAAVMLFYAITRLLSAYDEKRRLVALEALSDIRPDKVRIEREDGSELRNAADAAVDDIILVEPGEYIALDGEIIEGMSEIDESPVAGAGQMRTVGVGSRVFAGTKNISRPLRIRVTAEYRNTVVNRCIEYAVHASDSASVPGQRAEKASRIFTPVVLALALLIALVPSVITGRWLDWIGRALIFAAISSSALLVSAVRLAYFGGVCSAARSGIIVKGDDILENLAHIETAVFDKTGTITEGRFDVTEIFPVGMTEDELLDLAATAESCSEHPIARSLREAGHVKLPEDGKVLAIEEIPGRGISAFIDGHQVYVGNAALLEEHGIAFTVPSRPGAAIHVAVDGNYAGHIMISDRVRPSAFDALEELRANGAKMLVMLTGDVRSAAKAVASSLNFDMVKSELSPEGKISAVEYMHSKKTPGSCVAFVGDGVDDAAVMSHADVGIAMAALGTDEAIASADAVLLGEDIRNLPLAARICRRTSEIVREDAILSAIEKLAVMLLGVFGVIPLWLAAVIDSAAMSAVIINSMRTVAKVKEPKK